MKIVTKRYKLDHIAEQYYRAFHQGGDWTITGTDHAGRYAKLLNLGFPTEEAVNQILGEGWVTILCSSCDKSVDAAVVMDVTGGEYDTHICYDCLAKALALFPQVDDIE